MDKKSHDMTAHFILDSVGSVNPHRRSGSNAKHEYYIYQMGYVASYLASLMQDDPRLIAQFKRHIKQQQSRQR